MQRATVRRQSGGHVGSRLTPGTHTSRVTRRALALRWKVRRRPASIAHPVLRPHRTRQDLCRSHPAGAGNRPHQTQRDCRSAAGEQLEICLVQPDGSHIESSLQRRDHSQRSCWKSADCRTILQSTRRQTATAISMPLVIGRVQFRPEYFRWFLCESCARPPGFQRKQPSWKSLILVQQTNLANRVAPARRRSDAATLNSKR